eukprot:COSAG02_NODE_6592_length_3474_cov_1.889185_6_plen_104_part_00
MSQLRDDNAELRQEVSRLDNIIYGRKGVMGGKAGPASARRRRAASAPRATETPGRTPAKTATTSSRRRRTKAKGTRDTVLGATPRSSRRRRTLSSPESPDGSL